MSEFVDYLHEVFASFGTIRSRKMFGGHGIYHQDRMIGLVADDVLYLKVDKESENLFTELGLEPFVFEAKGKTTKMSYYTAPEEIYDEPEQACIWAEHAYAAAIRSGKPAGSGSKKRKKK